MKKMMMSLVRGGLLGVGLAFVCRAMGYELSKTHEGVLVLSLAVVIGFRDWIYPPKEKE